MGKVYFTSDMHLGHKRIIEYCNRPFTDVSDMNTTLIYNWNSRVKREDIVYHLGDFCFYKSSQGSDSKAIDYEKELNGRIIHVLGNHDKNNSITSGYMDSCILKFGGYKILAVHKPPRVPEEIPKGIDVVLCGHVHNIFKYCFIGNTLVLNVGVDVNKFMPISATEVAGMASRLIYQNKKGEI